MPALDALQEVATVVGVVTQPDRPAGRGLVLQSPAIKLRARELGLEVTQPSKVRDGTLRTWLAERRADAFLVLAYGRILPPDILTLPPAGALNLHASLLPKYRGAAPIQWAIIRGETTTGISLMQMNEGLDTGPVRSRHSLSIGESETAGELAQRLAVLAADVVRRDFVAAVKGELPSEPQDDALATLAPPLRREDGHVDFTKSANEVANLVRGLAPRPGAYTSLAGKQLKLLAVRVVERAREGLPGSVEIRDGSPCVLAGEGAVEIVRAQLEGKRESTGRDLVNGRTLAKGQVLGDARSAP